VSFLSQEGLDLSLLWFHQFLLDFLTLNGKQTHSPNEMYKCPQIYMLSSVDV